MFKAKKKTKSTRKTGAAGRRVVLTGGPSAGKTAIADVLSRHLKEEVVVVPDPNSNSLLIAANKTRYEELLELVRQLDRRQDQVLIESALIELTGADFRCISKID